MKINPDICELCGLCAGECEQGAITPQRVDGLCTEMDYYVIDAVLCVDCGACAAKCPTGAIEEGV